MTDSRDTAAEVERIWQWLGDLIEELEEVQAALAVLYADEEGKT